MQLYAIAVFSCLIRVISLCFRSCFRTEQIKLLGEMVEGEGEANQMEVGTTVGCLRVPR